LASPCGAHVAHDDRPRVHADAHPERRLAARHARCIEGLQAPLHRERTPHGARRMVCLVDGAPKYAISPSPRYLSSVPPYAKTSATIASWNSFSIATTCGPARCSLSAVKPRRSLKSTVASRVSPAASVPPASASHSATCGEK